MKKIIIAFVLGLAVSGSLVFHSSNNVNKDASTTVTTTATDPGNGGGGGV